MKDYIYTLLFILTCFFGCSCTKMVYVPFEQKTVEYKDNYIRDSIHVKDSIYFALKGDTVYLEKYRVIYKDKIIKDSVFIKDSIQVPYPVEKIVSKKNKVNYWLLSICCVLFIIVFKPKRLIRLFLK